MATKKEVMTPETKLKEISVEVKRIQKTAESLLKIKTQEEVVKATKFLSVIKGRLTRIEELRTFFVSPLNEQVKKINAMFKKQSEPLKTYMDSVKRAVADYAIAEERKIRAEEERLRIAQEKKNEKREAQGKPIDLTPAPTIERAESTIKTDTGKTTTIKVWKFEIEAYSKLLQNVIDEVLYQAKEAGIHEKVVRKMVSAGVREINGVRIYEDIQVNVSAR